MISSTSVFHLLTQSKSILLKMLLPALVGFAAGRIPAWLQHPLQTAQTMEVAGWSEQDLENALEGLGWEDMPNSGLLTKLNYWGEQISPHFGARQITLSSLRDLGASVSNSPISLLESLENALPESPLFSWQNDISDLFDASIFDAPPGWMRSGDAESGLPAAAFFPGRRSGNFMGTQPKFGRHL